MHCAQDVLLSFLNFDSELRAAISVSFTDESAVTLFAWWRAERTKTESFTLGSLTEKKLTSKSTYNLHMYAPNKSMEIEENYQCTVSL